MNANVIETLWIDGQKKDGSNAGPIPLELRLDGERFRWYCQDYNQDGIPGGDCVLDTEISGSTEDEAMEAAWQSWGSSAWNLRTAP
ncbi:hypothetical protein [Methylocaldum gracile]|jgi:hypothetical protein|uniref:hypothetical protein n=1 Tax=Methylocaldum sp. 0917 TaxID=2485163 RepID=UPI001061E4E9